MRDATSSHGDEISALAERIGGRFGWGTGSTFRVLESWISRTASLHKVERGPRYPAAVIKIADDWDPATVEDIVEELTLLAGELKRSDLEHIAIPELMGWDEFPPSVCYEYVDGLDFEQVLREGFEKSPDTIESTIRQAGGFLGLFHTVWLDRLGTHDLEEGALGARREVGAIARRLLISSASLRGFDFRGAVSRQYGDFGPHNLRISDRGKVYVVDQPRRWRAAPVHLDVAYFLYHVERKLAYGESWDHANTSPALEQLARALLEGYRQTGPVSLSTPQDVMLISLHMSHKHLGRAKGELVRRRFETASRHMRLALKWRKAVLQPFSTTQGPEEDPARIAS